MVTLSKDLKTSELRTEGAHPQDAVPLQPTNGLGMATLSVRETDASRASADQPPRPDKVSGNLRALLVEDEPADVELVMRALRKAGFEATNDVAQTVGEFTDLVRKHSYDIGLADYKLSTWNGMESVEALRQEGLDIPVILVTGALGEFTAVECINEGADDYLSKEQLVRLP